MTLVRALAERALCKAYPPVALLAIVLTFASASGQTVINVGPLRFQQVATTQHSLELGIPVDIKVAPDGHVYIADIAMKQVIKVGPDGSVVWRAGRDGDGPGEYRMPYRVATTPDGELLVYDLGRQDITRLASATGRYAGRDRLPFPVHPLDELVVTPSAHVAVAGITQWGENAAGHSVHIFDRTLRHVTSFGPLPTTLDHNKLRLWGAGVISVSATGNLWLSSAEPYKLLNYSVDGLLLNQIDAPFKPRATLDEIISFGERGKGISIDDDQSLRLHRVHEIGDGRLLMSRAFAGVKYLDLYTKGGSLQTAPLPQRWFNIAGYHASTNTVWVSETIDDVPVVSAYRILPTGGR